MLSLILKENTFQFKGKDYLQTHGTVMVPMAVAFSNIFLASIEKEILRQSVKKPLNKRGKGSLMMHFACGIQTKEK